VRFLLLLSNMAKSDSTSYGSVAKTSPPATSPRWLYALGLATFVAAAAFGLVELSASRGVALGTQAAETATALADDDDSCSEFLGKTPGCEGCADYKDSSSCTSPRDHIVRLSARRVASTPRPAWSIRGERPVHGQAARAKTASTPLPLLAAR